MPLFYRFAICLFLLMIAGCRIEEAQPGVEPRSIELRLNDFAASIVLEGLNTSAKGVDTWCAQAEVDSVIVWSGCAPQKESQFMVLDGTLDCVIVSLDANADSIWDARSRQCAADDGKSLEIAVYAYNEDPAVIPPIITVSPSKAAAGEVVTVGVEGEFAAAITVEAQLRLHRDDAWVYWQSPADPVSGVVKLNYEFEVQPEWPATNGKDGSSYHILVKAGAHLFGGPNFILLGRNNTDPVPVVELGEFSFTLNSGAATTNIPEVTVRLQASGASFMRIAFRSDLENFAWAPFSETVAITLPSAGTHTIYAQVASVTGSLSTVRHGAIQYPFLDRDADGLPDEWEASHGLDAAYPDGLADPDGDGLTNIGEHAKQTDPWNADTDGDLASDSEDPLPLLFDGASPVIVILDAPGATTDQSSLSIAFAADEAAVFQCKYDDTAWSPCASPFELASTPLGAHTLQIHGTDLTGNATTTPTLVTWTRLEGIGPWVAVSVGSGFACAIDNLQHLWCWGRNNQGQLGLSYPSSSTGFSSPGVQPLPGKVDSNTWLSVSTADFTCGIRTNNSLWCWGSENTEGQLGTGGGSAMFPTQVSVTSDWARVAVYAFNACALKQDGSAWCWGQNSIGELGIGPVGNRSIPTRVGSDTWIDIGFGRERGCGIQTDGSLWCWGNNNLGQLGVGDTTERWYPTRIGTADNWTALSLSHNVSCALNTQDELYCWGSNADGQLATGSRSGPDACPGGSCSKTPIQIAGAWKAISKGPDGYDGEHLCGITIAGQLKCWGGNYFEEAGDPVDAFIEEPRVLDERSDWTSVSKGITTTCGIRGAGHLYCWGSQQDGATGLDLPPGYRVRPTAVAGQQPFSSLQVGGFTSCGVTAEGVLWCWGADVTAHGNAEVREFLDHPFAPTGPTGYLSFSVSKYFSQCVVRNGGELACWGSNGSGELGRGNQVWGTAPEAVAHPIAWAEVYSGHENTCALDVENGLFCWGSNESGQLAQSLAVNVILSPMEIALPGIPEQVALGSYHSCAIGTLDQLWCWGSNAVGQMGTATTQSTIIQPTALPAASGWLKASAGAYHTCGIQGDNSLWCWGSNTYGQIGISFTGAMVTTPALVNNSRTWTSVSVGANHSCAVAAPGEIYCWGSSENGRLGIGTPVASLVRLPTKVEGSNDWAQVSAGSNHTCALALSGAAYCWGVNTQGQIGDGLSSSHLPLPVAR